MLAVLIGVGAVAVLIGIIYWWCEYWDDGDWFRQRFLGKPSYADEYRVKAAWEAVDDVFQHGADLMIRVKTGRK